MLKSQFIRGMLLIALLLVYGCAAPSQAERHLMAHPDKAGAQIEYFIEHPAGRGPWPTVILLHGYQGALERRGGRIFADWGELSRLAGQGYLAVAVSLPGYGGSSGPADFAGPITQQVVRAVMARLKRDGDARPDKMLIQGASLGAVTAALVAAQEPDLAGLVLISGLYDLPPFLNHPKTAAAAQIRDVALAQAGGGSAALEGRSALRIASRIRAATLILNGANDDRTDPAQARQLAAAINASGGTATVRIYPGIGHAIPVRLRAAVINAHIDRVMK